MKTAVAAAITASLFVVAPALAGHEGHDAGTPDEQEDLQAPAAAPACPPVSQALFDVMLSNLQVQVEAIRATDDPEERHRLMRNHLQTLREALDLAGAREGGMGSRARPRPGSAEGEDKGMGMMRKPPMHREMEQRVDRLHRLLDQLIEHEQLEDETGGRG
jgi:hypothetical protein